LFSEITGELENLAETKPEDLVHAHRERVAERVTLGLLGGSLFWVYESTLRAMAERWSIDPRYSHGYLVPVFAALLLWLRRELRPSSVASSQVRWLGAVVMGLGMAVHLAGARFYVNWFEAAALLPMLAGITLLGGGWTALRWAGPSIGFLVFMFPLPFRLEVALGAPLQGVAAWWSTFFLQVLGQPAIAQGNIIELQSSRLGVVEACNGLGMLATFTALATALALIIDRPWPERLVIVVSAVPISFVANVARITATGFLQETVGHRVAGVVYHDLAGWLMMPLALVLLWGELQLLSRLFVDAPDAGLPARLDGSTIPG
jgi:exosortase